MMVAWIVGNMHVGTSYRDVVREFCRRFKSRMPLRHAQKALRKAIYREAIEAHRANRQLCIDFRL